MLYDDAKMKNNKKIKGSFIENLFLGLVFGVLLGLAYWIFQPELHVYFASIGFLIYFALGEIIDAINDNKT